MRQSTFLKLFLFIGGIAAVGSAVVVGFWGDTEVRGDTLAQQAVPKADTRPRGPAEYLLGLNAEDFATYTDPVQHFSFVYPRDFTLHTGVNDSSNIEDVYVVASHPDLPLGLQVRRWLLPAYDDIRDEVFSRLAENGVEAPDGADGKAVAWINEDMPEMGVDTAQFWCVRGGGAAVPDHDVGAGQRRG
jgi:hypothetical protein